ncbi:MAG TPA: sulfotransferase, partial [Steroidobacteraceae bacterium]|nr:sulfotransferase [Steroidobacteraceae bacterium]
MSPSSQQQKSLAIAALRAGNFAVAVEHLKEFLSAEPSDAEIHCLQGQLLQKLNRLDEARSHLLKAVELAPTQIDYRITLTEFFASQANWAPAIEHMRVAVTQNPKNVHAWQRLGDFLGSAQLGEDALVAYQRARALDPSNIDIAMKEAFAMAYLKRFDAAREILERYMATANVSDAFLSLYTDILEAQCDWATLENVAATWSTQRPTQLRAWEAQAKAAWETGRLQQAINLYRKAMSFAAPDAKRLATFAQLCLNALEYDQASRALDEAEKMDARNVSVLSAKAGLLMFLGRFDEAAQYCQRGLAIDSHDVTTYRILSQLQRGRLTSDDRRVLAEVVQGGEQKLDYRISAAFTLGDSFDADSDIANAMASYDEAHRLATQRGAAEGLVYDPEARSREIDFLIAHFSSTPSPSVDVFGPRPIFVVGMPRSGTTLIESVLGAHSRVFACGERNAMRQILRDYFSAGAKAELSQLVRRYFAGLPDLHAFECVTDKNPWNFDAIGLILTLFPRAKIVHVRRNPIETCLSILRNEFTKFQPFTQHPDHIGHYYGQYARLMNHWERIADDRLITIQYENFAAHFANAAPALIRSCGLEWEESCGTFQKSNRVIATLSTV